MAAPVSIASQHEPLTVLPPELRPSVEHLVTEDDAPVDSVYSEKQMRLMTRPLYSSWPGPKGDGLFLAFANVGLFFAVDQPPLVPDVLLSLGVKVPADVRPKRHRSYFIWEYGKVPDVVIEVVSNQEGGELSNKKDQYALIGVPIYVVWDPLKLLSTTPLLVFGLHIKAYEALSPAWFNAVGLGLTVWHGAFEKMEADWLRWCDREGQVIPLGEERAEKAEERAVRLAAQLRQLGIDPANGIEK
jgi:Putative restriction endonuclease